MPKPGTCAEAPRLGVAPLRVGRVGWHRLNSSSPAIDILFELAVLCNCSRLAFIGDRYWACNNNVQVSLVNPAWMSLPPRTCCIVWVYVFVYVYVGLYIYIHMHKHTQQKYIYTHIYMYIYIYICICIDVYLRISLCFRGMHAWVALGSFASEAPKDHSLMCGSFRQSTVLQSLAV